MTAAPTPALAELASIDIPGLHAGKWWKSFQPWRVALAEMIGAEIDYALRLCPFEPVAQRSDLASLAGLQVLEARSITGAHGQLVTEAMRRGDWAQTPDEPLLILLLLSLPGAVLPVRHAGAIAERLEDLTPLIEALDPSARYGMALLDMHAAAVAFFHDQQRDVAVDAEFLSPAGDFLLREVRLSSE